MVRGFMPIVLRQSLLNRVTFPTAVTQVKYLFTDEFLALDAFKDNRSRIIGQFGPMRGKYYKTNYKVIIILLTIFQIQKNSSRE